MHEEHLPLSYWLGLVRSDAWWHLVKHRNPAAFVRAAWGTLVHRDNVQRCQDCGRRYLFWVVSDDLWGRIVGGRHDASGLCPGCLDRRAESKGITMLWVPEEWVDHDGEMDHLNLVCKRIGAFQ